MSASALLATRNILTSNEVKVIASIVAATAALAWPAVVIVLAIVFKSPIISLILRVKSVSAAGVAVEFEDKAQKAQAEADQLGVSDAAFDDATKTLINQAATLPWWTVTESWKRIRTAARVATDGGVGDGITTPARVRSLLANEKIEEPVNDLTKTLTSLYFEMKRAPGKVTPAAATDYCRAAAQLVAKLRDTVKS